MNPTEYIGLGLALKSLSFYISFERIGTGYGFKVRRCISLKENVTDDQKKCIEAWANTHDLTVYGFKTIQREELVRKWMDILEPFEFLMKAKDRVNYWQMKWILDNPYPRIPKSQVRNWPKFRQWVDDFDANKEKLELDYLN